MALSLFYCVFELQNCACVRSPADSIAEKCMHLHTQTVNGTSEVGRQWSQTRQRVWSSRHELHGGWQFWHRQSCTTESSLNKNMGIKATAAQPSQGLVESCECKCECEWLSCCMTLWLLLLAVVALSLHLDLANFKRNLGRNVESNIETLNVERLYLVYFLCKIVKLCCV